jgi:integrase
MKNSKLSSEPYDNSLQRSLQVFEESIKSDVTRKGYKKRLETFLKFTKIKNYDSLVKTDPKTLQKLVENYIIQLKQKHRLGILRANSFNMYLAPIDLFFTQNDIILNFKKVKRMFPQREKLTGEQPFTTDDITKMLKNSNLRWRAIIHFLASTGVRPGAIFDLKLKDVKEMEDGCMAVKIYADDPQEYWVFLTPEATRALKEYFDKRTFHGEKMNSESLVFRNHYREAMAWHNVKKISSTSFYTTLAKIQEKAGIRKRFSLTKERHDKRIVYGFRKRYNTAMKLKKEVNSNIAEKLMGHKNGLDGVYFTPTIEECFEEFKKVVPELTISDELRQKMLIKQQEKKITELERNQMKIQHLEEGVNIVGSLFAEQMVKSELSEQLEHPTHHHTKEQELNLEKFVKSPPNSEVLKAYLEWSKRGPAIYKSED